MKTEIFSKSNTPKTKRGEDRQKKLLNTAIKVFLEHGYEGASLEKIILTPAAHDQPSIRYTDLRRVFFWPA